MKKTVLFSMITIALVFSAGLAMAKSLPVMKEVEKNMFKDLAKQNINPAITGWGLGLNTASDSYLVAKFHAVSEKTLPRKEILRILKDAKAGNGNATWSEIKDSVKAAIAANSTTVSKGRVQINRETFILSGISRTNTTFTADIRSKPDYTACSASNVSSEDCESNSTKAGDLSLTKKMSEINPERHKLWAGTLNFNGTAYTFVALVNPMAGEKSGKD